MEKSAQELSAVEGRIDALTIALRALVAVLPAEYAEAFAAQFQHDVGRFEDMVMSMPAPDDYFHGLRSIQDKWLAGFPGFPAPAEK
ncbi:hypothetical protein [Achromobacter pulmonis]|uniref:hypothetical protein n=1 Tax=Achromobacter pulmonis TaxID=1389932 RepID=UPI003C788C3B